MNEDEIVRLLSRRFGGKSPFLKKGIGDDAAVILPDGSREYWAISTDMLLEDVDFREGWLSPAELGHKSLAVNLSDLAAMGAQPRFFTVALAVPPGTDEKWLASFYGGMMRLARRFDAALIGGDLSRSTCGFQITVTVLGRTSHRKVIYRSGGRPGDVLWVTGVLGRSAAGLRLLLGNRLSGKTRPEREALKAHRMPQPRCEAGSWLARSGLASCMIDLSDGLSTDLSRLCRASHTGAEVHASLLPLFSPAEKWGADPLKLGLDGGEDFELLFAVPEEKIRRLVRYYPAEFPPITRIGLLTAGGVTVAAKPGAIPRALPPRGFDHFNFGDCHRNWHSD